MKLHYRIPEGLAIVATALLAAYVPGLAWAQLTTDLTVGTNRFAVDRTYTYNLGPTGMRGWIHICNTDTSADPGSDGNNIGDFGTMTKHAPWQIHGHR